MATDIPQADSGVSNLKTIFDPTTLVRKGLCPVTDIKARKGENGSGESHSLYFEQHGTGPEKVLFIMGCVVIILFRVQSSKLPGRSLNSTSFAWLPQVAHFGRAPEYSVLVFDNRGVGNSTTPKGPYTYIPSSITCTRPPSHLLSLRTSSMAEDVLVLLDYVGWTQPRDLHVVGISMGGMIAQGDSLMPHVRKWSGCNIWQSWQHAFPNASHRWPWS